MAKCQRRLCKAHLPIPVWYRNSLNIHGIQLQVSLTFKVQGLKWHEWQCGIEHTPQVTWPMPQLGLGWYPCHAMRSTTRRFAWKRLADRVSRTKACEKNTQQVPTGRNGVRRVKCFSFITEATTLIILTQCTFSYSQREKVGQGGTWEIFYENSCKLQVDLKIRWMNSSVFSSKFLLDWMPFRMVFLTMSPTCPSWRVHREHQNLELPGPSLRNGNLGNCM